MSILIWNSSREALNLKRRARRWMVICYWASILTLICAFTALSGRQSPDFVNRTFFWFWWTLIVFPVFLRTIVTSSTRGRNLQTLMKPADDGGYAPRALDERELSLQMRMHTKAYYLLQIFVPIVVLLLTPPEIHKFAWLAYVHVPLLWLLSFVVTSLPQSLIIWTEPDMPTEIGVPQ